MTTTLRITPQTIGLAAAGAAALGLSLSEGLLQPLGTIERLAAEKFGPRTKKERRAAAAAAAAPTAEQAAELARQLAEHGGPAAVAADPLSVRTPGYDPEFTPNPEDFGQLN